MWRVLKLETLLWAHMYDDTVHYARENSAELQLPYDRSSKIEPEIVFKLKQPIASAGLDAAAVLQNIDWLAIGFEIIDCPYPDWQFKPADFVAAYGLHLALVVGQPLPLESELLSTLVDGLANFRVRISRNGDSSRKAPERTLYAAQPCASRNWREHSSTARGRAVGHWGTRQHRHSHDRSSDHAGRDLAGRCRWPAPFPPDSSTQIDELPPALANPR